jgi:hypothetical protein
LREFSTQLAAMKLDAEADQNVQLSLHFVPERKEIFMKNQVWYGKRFLNPAVGALN